MMGRHQHLNRFVIEPINHHFRRMGQEGIIHDDRQIHQPILKHLERAIAPQRRDSQLHLRVELTKPLKHRRQIMGADRMNSSHT